MSYAALDVTAPHATAYDEDYPTRSTENYAHALHDILQDMEDASGTWYLSDGNVLSATQNVLTGYIHDMIEDVFDYAEGAIDTYRNTGTPVLAHPTKTTIRLPGESVYQAWSAPLAECYISCMKVCYLVYYMWKTEEDPLLLKEKLQELLIAWPLLDTTVELNSDLGQQFKIYPSWKNADL